MSTNVSHMGVLLEQFRQANIQRNMEKILDIVIQIMNLYRQSDFLQNNANFKKMMFKKMAEFLESIKHTNAIQNEVKKAKYVTILETMIDTYYQGYKDAPFNQPLYMYLQSQYILPSQRYDPEYNNENWNTANFTEFILAKAPTQDIADKIRADIKRNIETRNGGKRKSKRKSRKSRKVRRYNKRTMKNRRC